MDSSAFDTITISGTSWAVDASGYLEFTDLGGVTMQIGKLERTGRNHVRGRIFGTYISAEGSGPKVVAAMLVAGYVAAMQLTEPSELPF